METQKVHSTLLKENEQNNPTILIEQTKETEQPEQTEQSQQRINGEKKNKAKKIAPFTLTQWNDQKSLIQQKHPELTDEDLLYEEGKYDELYNRVQIRFDEILDKAKMLH